MSEETDAERRLDRINALGGLVSTHGYRKYAGPEMAAEIEACRDKLENDLTEKQTTEIRARIRAIRWVIFDLLGESSLRENAKVERGDFG